MLSAEKIPILETWTVGEAAKVMGAQIAPRWANVPMKPVSTDSRAIAAGEFFLALPGENFDGHRFVSAALEHGAAGLIVDSQFAPGTEPDVPVLRVADPLRAYGDLAAALRVAWPGKVLGISGSAGKTTTRRLVAATLAARIPVLEPLRNFNNLIGVPHTLLRLEARHKAAVVELGMNMPGELRRLTEIARPSAALMTMIGRAHIGMFPDAQALIDAKLDLFRGCEPGVPLAVNAACVNTMRRVGEFAPKHPVIYFLGDRQPAESLPQAAALCRILNVKPLEPVGYAFDLQTPAGALRGLELRHFGRHILEDVAAASALLFAGGFDPRWIAEALPEFRSEALRGEVIETEGMTFLLDCYNAAPDSMLAALASLGDLPRPRRLVLVLADMLELGEMAESIHAQLLAPLRTLGPDAIYGLGPRLMEVCATLNREGLAARPCKTREELIEILRSDLREGDFVFFKGSHGFRLELAAAALAPGLANADHA